MPTRFLYENLAFSSANDNETLVKATARSLIQFDAKTSLNVEWFGTNDSDSESWPILAFVHGVCESAETIMVQNLAQACCTNKWRLVVLELEGHGLSSGARAVCGDFGRLVQQVASFCQHVANNTSRQCPIVLSGSSLGGTLAAYAASQVKSTKRANHENDDVPNLVGVALFSPAVGISPVAVPPPFIVGALSVLSMIAPSAAIMTPEEDPSHYACPATSTRNFSGQWPLATSKMLLDVTTTTVQQDLEAGGRLTTLDTDLLVISGGKDNIVPIETVRAFVRDIPLPKDRKTIKEVAKGDHGLLMDKKTSETAIQYLFEWLDQRVAR